MCLCFVCCVQGSIELSRCSGATPCTLTYTGSVGFDVLLEGGWWWNELEEACSLQSKILPCCKGSQQMVCFKVFSAVALSVVLLYNCTQQCR